MKQAFSLVELSIVLVILGLLVGGILTGQSLIRAAELRSVTREYSTYQTAAMTFRDKYFARPGDMTNATDFWGSAGGSGVLGDGCEAATGTGTETCNGNGDGQLNHVEGAGEYGEVFTFWQHLANAGMIEGNYTGISGTDNEFDARTGINVPAAKVANACWAAYYYDNTDGTRSAIFDLNLGNHLQIGAESTSWSTEALCRGSLFTPEEAWNIDKKLDDGKPAQGIVTIDDAALYCTDAADNSSASFDADYLLSSSDILCSIIFRNAF